MSVQDGLFQFYDAPFFGLQSPESMDDLADALRQNKVAPDRVDAFIADLLFSALDASCRRSLSRNPPHRAANRVYTLALMRTAA